MSVQPAALPVDVRVYLRPEERREALLRDVRAGLAATRKELPPKWFYDERGSELFSQITRLPEYYPTRREREILERRAAELARETRAEMLVELGSGTSEKTRLLLDALDLDRFVAFDVSEETLRESAMTLAEEYPGLAVMAIVGDFERHLSMLPRGGLVAFLGSSVGNFPPAERAAFLGELHGIARWLLLGLDLVKDPDRLVAAYDDAAGVTAEFNRNVLRVINRELGADFDPMRFDHVARWDAHNEWVELALRSRDEQTVRIPAADLIVRFERGEELRTEISAKFRPERAREELAAAGFELRRVWTDAQDDFALALAVPG